MILYANRDCEGSLGVILAAFLIELTRISVVGDVTENAGYSEGFTDWSLQSLVTIMLNLEFMLIRSFLTEIRFTPPLPCTAAHGEQRLTRTYPSTSTRRVLAPQSTQLAADSA